MSPEALAGLLQSMIADRDALHAMADRAYRLARRDATRMVAEVCMEVAA